MAIDWQWVVGGSAATVVALVGAVYTEPRSYDAFLAPVLKYLSFALFIAGIGAFVGQIYLFQVIQHLIVPEKLADAKQIFADAKAITYLGQISAMLVFVLDIVLFSISRKVKEWKGLDRTV